MNNDQRHNEASASDTSLANIDAYWRAANYLSVGQIYLHDNPPLKRPLKGAAVMRSSQR